MDAILIVIEAIDARLKNGLNDIICKLNIKKAYNYVNLACFLEISTKWCLVKNGLVGSNDVFLLPDFQW